MTHEFQDEDTWIYQAKHACISTYYDIDYSQKLGEGGYASVYKAKDKENNTYKAVKIFDKFSNSKNKNIIISEIDILLNLQENDNRHIIKLDKIFENAMNIYLILEYCGEGELYNLVMKNSKLEENQAKYFFRQMVNSIKYCHSKNVIHCDIKLENFMLTQQSNEQKIIKLIDFGLAKQYTKGERFNQKAGSLFYISPETLKGSFNETCDIWSLGILLYIMLTGIIPFFGQTTQDIVDNILALNFTQKISQLKISQNAKDLLTQMICFEEDRMTLSEIIQHPWMQIVQRPSNLNTFQNTTWVKFIIKDQAQIQGKSIKKINKSTQNLVTCACSS